MADPAQTPNPPNIPIGDDGESWPFEIAVPRLQAMAKSLLDGKPGFPLAYENKALIEKCEAIVQTGRLEQLIDYQELSIHSEWRERMRWKVERLRKLLELHFPHIDEYDSAELPMDYSIWNVLAGKDVFHRDEGPFPYWSKPERYLTQAMCWDDRYCTVEGAEQAVTIILSHMSEIDVETDQLDVFKLVHPNAGIAYESMFSEAEDSENSEDSMDVD